MSEPRVALLERRGKFTVAEPFFASGPRLAVTVDGRAGIGDLVVVRVDETRDRRGGRGSRGGRAKVVRRLGRPDIARDVIEALMIDRGLRRTFDPAVAHEARDASTEEVVAETSRRDLRDTPTFTIDPATAKDFDDAISAVALTDGSWRVWVHIADVCAYVAPKSLVDREGYRRATSVYVPGAVEPMLPEALSNKACSLVPGQDRATVTVEMVIGADGVVSGQSAFYRSVIRSDERLDYDRVDRIFAGSERAGAPWGDGLAAARAASGALGARRAARAALTLESEEPEFRFDRDGNVVAITPVAQTESHRLIEHLMIAANEQVAGFLEARRIPALYRVHERPDAAAVERLLAQLASLGVPTPPGPRGHMSSEQAADLVGEVSQSVERWLAGAGRGRGRRALTSLILRSLKQAYYDPRNLGHAGLQSPRYCHFTSPILRYPDVICHRALLSGLDGSLPAPDPAWVAAAGPWTSTREREAMSIERAADDIARCFMLERCLFAEGADRVFEGEVVGLAGAGAFVAFGEEGAFEGLLPVRRLRGDWWELNDEGTMLVGTRSGSSIRLGDPVTVRVGQIDAPRGRVDLMPVSEDD
ncbi:MAG TPA: RNB domain-containing ribonuclease [Solirubrobacteraceae bacterium]|nr:RNB domain-containing ribonuclease [Solirubrobacteraceae bacterium]